MKPMIGSTFGIDSPRVRRTDPLVSHEAADHNDVETSIGLVLAALRSFGPSADHELVQMLSQSGFTPQRLRTARAALVDRGLVEQSGIYRLTAHNRRAIVWSVVDTSDESAVPERRVLMSDPMPVIKDILGFGTPKEPGQKLPIDQPKSQWFLSDEQAQTLHRQMDELHDRMVAAGYLDLDDEPDPDDDPDPDEFTPADEMRADAQRYDRRYGE